MDRAASVHTRASRTCTCESGTAWAVKVVSRMSGARATPDLHASAHALAQSTHAPENLGPWPQPLHTHAFCVLCLAEIGTLNVGANLNTFCH